MPKAENFRATVGSIIALCIIAGTIGIDVLVLLKEIKSNDNTTMMVLTSLNSASTIILGYYFGSSKAMTDKIKAENPTEIISKETTISQTKNETK